MLRCPVCGCEINPIYLNTYSETQTVIENGVEIVKHKCGECSSFVTPIKLKHNSEFYHNKSQELYGTPWRDKQVILEEIKEYGLFDEEKHKIVDDANSEICRRNLQKSYSENQPKCPTCGSTKIKKISTASKIVGASLFGLLSKNATSQFKCDNCGYKW